jgi:quaternary ammonium compound-resistance protein SugE
MSWFCLLAAGVLEIVWAFAMKQADGFTKPIPSLITIAGMILSFWLLSLSMKSLPLGTAYPIWTGIGAVGAFVVGIVAFGEPLSFPRALAACLIVSGLALMKIS